MALAGESFGGLCAGWTALHHPDAFGNAILQSPSCGYHPDLTWGTGAASCCGAPPYPTADRRRTGRGSGTGPHLPRRR
ncbi:hypothetical protein GTW37_30520 [Streptomyces sp. SID4931]|nr:hypothetical protein [Streptomyces sp. SID4931]